MVSCLSDRMQCSDWLHILTQRDELRCVVGSWLGLAAASGAMARRDGSSCALQGLGYAHQPTLRQHPVDAGQPDGYGVSVARRPRV
jgi:hypothetical protein